MRLTYFSDYAFRVLMYLAVTPDRRCTIREISEAYDISRAHLMKVVNLLTREGLVTAQRGPNGGLTLAMPAERDPARRRHPQDRGRPRPGRVLPPGERVPPDARLRLAPALSRAMQAFLAELDKQTIADLVRKPQTIRRLLKVPA
jgi:Rrf2 family transcriptional regulator, nitric oxide-sensitive transcriptional repressor